MVLSPLYADGSVPWCYIVWRNPEGDYGQRVSTGRCAVAWSLVVDDLWGLNKNCYYTVGYADDIAILINGKFTQTASEVLQTAPYTVQRWYERRKLSINPNKTVVIPFTRKRNIKELKEPIPLVKGSSYPVKSSILE
jgi:hypothetical protein